MIDIRDVGTTHHVGAEQTITLIEQTLGKDVRMKRDDNEFLDEDGMEVFTRGYRAGKRIVCIALGCILEAVNQLQPHERREFIEVLKAVVDGCPNRDDDDGGGKTILHKHCDLAESQ